MVAFSQTFCILWACFFSDALALAALREKSEEERTRGGGGEEEGGKGGGKEEGEEGRGRDGGRRVQTEKERKSTDRSREAGEGQEE